MAYHVELTARARRDLESLYQFVHAAESEHAFAWFNGLADALVLLSKSPYRSPVTRENAGLRNLLDGKKPHIYRVIYHVDDASESVRVLTIRHGARKPLRSNPAK